MSAFDLAALRTLAKAYPPKWTVRAGADRIELTPGRAVFRRGASVVTLAETDGALTSNAQNAEDSATVEAIWDACREHATSLAAKRTEREAALRAMPSIEDSPLDRALFDAFMTSHPGAHGWELRIDEADAIMMQRAQWNAPAHVLFVRCLKPHGKADVQKDYVRVFVRDVDGVLRTEHWSEVERAFVAEMCARGKPALDSMLAARDERIARAVASAPKIDRAALTEAVTAMTHGRVNVAPIVDHVMLAAGDPIRFVRSNADRCGAFGIWEPTQGLHVVALLQALPRDDLLELDWKETMHEVLPMLASLVRRGTGATVDVERFRGKCDAWDKKSRLAAIREIAASLDDARVVQIKIEGDTLAFVCMTPKDAARVRSFVKNAHLPLAVVRG
ncbi:MAG TPA: hypothetical protein VGH28_21325 [Polyangiaceae bacterium]|jgi:hypothetical protein